MVQLEGICDETDLKPDGHQFHAGEHRAEPTQVDDQAVSDDR